MEKQHYYTLPDFANLPVISQTELDTAIQKHDRYLKGQNQGARAVFHYKNLSGLSMDRVHLPHADFTGCLMAGCQMRGGNFENTNFFACDMRHADLREANLERTDLRGAYIAGANLSGATMRDADLREGKIMQRGDQGILTDRARGGGDHIGAKTVLTGAKLRRVDMSDVQASAADFTDADLSNVCLRGSNLEHASFIGANLSDCDMSRSNASHVNMSKAIISGLNLNHTEQKDLHMDGTLDEQDMGRKLATIGKTLPELLDTHTLWVNSAGKQGKQLDLGKYDLRAVIDLNAYALTAVRAVDANFMGQNLQGANMQSGIFDQADFRDCNLDSADLRGSSFKYANFSRSTLTGSLLCPLEFDRSGVKHYQRADLTGANLRYADLSDCDVRDCIMIGADLTGALIREADLRKADLTGAIFSS